MVYDSFLGAPRDDAGGLETERRREPNSEDEAALDRDETQTVRGQLSEKLKQLIMGEIAAPPPFTDDTYRRSLVEQIMELDDLLKPGSRQPMPGMR